MSDLWIVVETPSDFSVDGAIESKLIRASSVSQVKIETVHRMDNDGNGDRVVKYNLALGTPWVSHYVVSVLSDGVWLTLTTIADKCGHTNEITAEALILQIYAMLGISHDTIKDVRSDRGIDCKTRDPLKGVPFILGD